MLSFLGLLLSYKQPGEQSQGSSWGNPLPSPSAFTGMSFPTKTCLPVVSPTPRTRDAERERLSPDYRLCECDISPDVLSAVFRPVVRLWSCCLRTLDLRSPCSVSSLTSLLPPPSPSLLLSRRHWLDRVYLRFPLPWASPLIHTMESSHSSIPPPFLPL